MPVSLTLTFPFLVLALDNYISDLIYSNLVGEAADWVVSDKVCSSCDPISSFYETCYYSYEPYNSTSHVTLFGGPNIMGPSGASTVGTFFEREYSLGTNTYNVLAIKFQLSILAQSSSSNDIKSYIDFSLNDAGFPLPSTAFSGSCSANFSIADPSTGTSYHTLNRKTTSVRVHVPFSSANTAKLRFTSKISEPSITTSFGLSSIYIYLMDTTNEGTYNYPCAISYYWDQTTCAPCHQFCATCDGPYYTNCSACTSPNYNYGNGTCFDSCPSSGPLAPSDSTGIRTCYYKCPGEYYWAHNDTCTPTCSFPYVVTSGLNSVKYCNSPCTSDQYLYPNGTCLDSCLGLLVNETLAETLKYCKSPCDFPQFLYPNGTCSMSCPSPLSNKTEYGILYCYSPCSDNEHLHANRTCFENCSRPLVSVKEGNFTFCRNPCDSLTLTTLPFLYPNSTCNMNCPSPLMNREEYGVKYCYTPCLESQYLYPNGTCAGCDTPWVKVPEPNTFKFCRNPCDPNGNMPYLYPDSSCNSTCITPLFEKTEPDAAYCWNPCVVNKTFLHESLQVCQETCPYPSITKNELYGKYCDFPCEDHNLYFRMIDKKCEETCEYPYQAIESPLPKLCSSSLTEEEITQIQKMAGVADSANSAASTGNLIWSLVSSGDSTAAMMGPLAKMLQYIKFMDLGLPEKVQFMLLEQTKKTNKKGFTQKMLGSALDKYPNHEVTENFKVYSIKSSFFANFWPSLFNLSVIFMATLLVMLATAYTKGNPKINGIMKSLSDVLKWNVFLTTFCGSIGDIVLYTSLEFQTMRFENAEAVFSFVLCLGMNALAVIVVVQILDVNSAIRRSKKKTQNEEEYQKMIAQEYSSYKALFECYKDYSFYQQIFLFVFIMRLVLFNTSIGYFYKYPLFQAATSLVTNILMLSYLVMKRPMRKIIALIQQIVLELVLLPFNVCVLALAIMDSQEILEIGHRKSIGNVIFYINVMLPVLSVVLMAAKFIAMAIDLYKTWRLSKLKKPVVSQARLFDASRNKSFSQTDNNPNTIQEFDLTDHSVMSPEINMMRSNSTLESPGYPRMSK